MLPAGPLPYARVMFSESELVLLSDQPVGEDGQEDLLFRSEAARQLAELIRASRNAAPFALAVYADWGMGKSSLLSQVAAQFKDAPDVKTVWFNAWTASRGDALESLIKSVLGQLDPNALRRLARRFGADTGPGAWMRTITSGLAEAFRLNHLVDEIWQQLAIDARVRNEARKQLAGVLREWTKGDGRTPGGRMIVVFVDDLDRCAPDVIGVVCDAVKQYLSVPGLVFVLGCDQSVIEASVATGQPPATAATIGRRYLEKIVQASYSIPVPTDEDAAKLVEGYARQSNTQALFQGAVADAVTRHAGRNPRRIKRLINRFVIEYRLDPQWRQFGADALIRVILLHDFYPEFYGLLARVDGLDPIDEFTEYLALRMVIGSGISDDGQQRVERFLSEHGIPDISLGEGGLTDELVAKAERELPPVYLTLARDKTFVSLVAELKQAANDEKFRAKLLRRRTAVAIAARPGTVYAVDGSVLYTPPERGATAVPGYSEHNLSGVHVLWIHAEEFDRNLGGVLTFRGAQFTWVNGGDEAVNALSAFTPTVVVSNLSRENNRDGGFEDLDRVRTRGRYTGPMIIYTSFVSPARRERAAELDARITDRESEIVDWLGDLADPTHADRPLRVLFFSDVETLVFMPLERLSDIVPVSKLSAATRVLQGGTIDAVVVHFQLYPPEGGIEDFVGALSAVFEGPILLYGGMGFSAEQKRGSYVHGAEVADTEDEMLLWIYARVAELRRGVKPQRGLRMNDEGRYESDYSMLRRAALEYVDRGDLDRAEQRWQTARDLAQAAHDTEPLLESLLALGEISMRRRRYAKAISRFAYARDRWPADHDPADRARLLNLLADAYDGNGEPNAAAAHRAAARRAEDAALPATPEL